MPLFKKRTQQLPIRTTNEASLLLRVAKEAIADAALEQALKHLRATNISAVEAEILALSARLASHQEKARSGILSEGQEARGFNRISRDILNLITTLEEKVSEQTKLYTELRADLKKRYSSRLEQKLAGRQPVNLRRLPSTEGTSEETSAIFVTYGSDEIQDEISKIFFDTHGRLLIVGEPGAGKTVLLLQLVLRLLESEQNAIPVILNLSTWQSSFVTLEAWIEKILPTELGINISFAKKLFQEKPLILLLDGFDEIKEEERNSCLESLGQYGANAERRYVICSRKEEYKSVLKDAAVYGQIEVGFLTLEQIESELQQIGYTQPEALPLLQAIKIDALLAEAIKTPFYFNTLQLLFAQGKRLRDLQFSTPTLEERQQEIVERFATTAIEKQASEQFPSSSTRQWLSFFAHQMNCNNLVVFELITLQYTWRKWSKIQLASGFVMVGIVEWLSIGIGIGIILLVISSAGGTLIKDLVGIITFTLWVILANGISFILFNFINNKKHKENLLSKNKINLKWAFKRILLIIIFVLHFSFFNFLYFLLFLPNNSDFTFSEYLVNIYLLNLVISICIVPFILIKSWKIIFANKITIKTKEKFKWSWKSFFNSWLIWLIPLMLIILLDVRMDPDSNFSSILYWFGLGFILSVIFGATGKKFSFIQIRSPYQRFTSSAKALHFSILQHWLLRYQLYQKGLLPFRLVDFLNEMVERKILETDGATWRFRHRILQDYFADLWKEQS